MGYDIIPPPGGGGGGKPTQATWEINRETLVASKVLVDADATVQWLDGGGASRVVTLPPITVDTPLFVFVNAGDVPIGLVQDNGRTLSALQPGETLRLTHDGIDAWSTGDGFAQSDRMIYPFGGDIGSNNEGLVANGYWDENGLSSFPDDQSEHGTPTAGVLSEFTGCFNSTGDFELEIYLNGALDQELEVTDLQVAVVPLFPTAISPGDNLSIRRESGSWSGTALLAVKGTPHVALPFGGWVNSPNRYLDAFASAGTTVSSVLGLRCEITCLVAAASASVAWISGSASNTEMELLRNGALDETFVMPGNKGQVTLSGTPYLAGDKVAVLRPSGGAGSNPVRVTAIVHFVGLGAAYYFGGAITTPGRFYPAHAPYSLGNSIAPTVPFERASITVPVAGVFTAIYRLSSTSIDPSISVFRNGALDQVVSAVGATTDFLGSVAGGEVQPSVFLTGDWISLAANSNAFQSTLGIYVV